MRYNKEQAIKAIIARLEGVWDDPQLVKLGPLNINEIEDIKIIINNTYDADLLEACQYAFENLRPKGNVKKDFSGHNAMATLSRAITKARGE